MLRRQIKPVSLPGTLRTKRLFTTGLLTFLVFGISLLTHARAGAPPEILGQVEYCLVCHTRSSGLGAYHDPAAIGCASCHGGNPAMADKKGAHAGMRLIPGQAVDAAESCGQSGCHVDAPANMALNIMSTMAGVVTLDRKAFGDPATGPAHVRALTHSPADDHLRTLCASCHLGNVKERWGPISQESRGGGCNACHLNYDKAARRDLAAYRKTRGSGKLPPPAHPALSLAVGDEHCFGCHSRSGRISLSYRGWAEVLPPAPRGVVTSRLADGRRVSHQSADVHAARMQCIDCHTQGEVMGDGRAHALKEKALDVACTDCHTRYPRSTPFAALSPAEQRVVIVRGRSLDARFVQTRNTGAALTGTEHTDEGVFSKAKRNHRALLARPPDSACEDGAHARLACEACHSAWAPQCFSCHTRSDPASEGYDLLENKPKKGDWIETPGDYRVAPPVLGVRVRSGSGREEITTFVPGMILAMKNSMETRNKNSNLQWTTRRYFGPLAPHTISRQARSCVSCHQSPDALGYGSGKLYFQREANTGRWIFTPTARRLDDGLPADAWIGFQSPASGPTLRSNTRSFSVVEQQRILRAGACLTCHAPGSKEMKRYMRDPAAAREKLGPACVSPAEIN